MLKYCQFMLKNCLANVPALTQRKLSHLLQNNTGSFCKAEYQRKLFLTFEVNISQPNNYVHYV